MSIDCVKLISKLRIAQDRHELIRKKLEGALSHAFFMWLTEVKNWSKCLSTQSRADNAKITQVCQDTVNFSVYAGGGSHRHEEVPISFIENPGKYLDALKQARKLEDEAHKQAMADAMEKRERAEYERLKQKFES